MAAAGLLVIFTTALVTRISASLAVSGLLSLVDLPFDDFDSAYAA